MTKEEMLKKISELSPEQKDFLKTEVRKHSPVKKENSDNSEEKNKGKSKK